MRYVTTTGRTFNLDKVNYALVFNQMLQIQTAGYNQVASISGPDFEPMMEALKGAGFVGENTLINPERVAAWEDAGTGARVYLEGADRSILMPLEVIKGLSSAGNTSVDELPIKPTRKKKAE